MVTNSIGVRGGGSGRAVAPPDLKNFKANSVFQGKRKLFKTPENKKYIFSTVNLGHPLLFRASPSFSELMNVKSIFNTVKNFRATLFFRASASCSKILNDKKYFNTVKNSRETLPFGASASCSKLLNVCRKIFRATLFFRASASWSKILDDKKYIFNTLKIPGQLCFSGQAQLAQNSECKKYVP